ncbi:DUF4139 domain-containing protein [Roseibium sediminicola]|uniref:DUF4139 domain-containing protein n=1 Tax=Roseibium sediminicola TaxID=2933272 RepID=A0ABT0GXX1_9HYPH|nr:DUF4139 domain-containing protein [Roseibium sp. CAU 1639]MCK7614282.1 DUF4139 domain-containing protein [Roseibium sp. CAU 1639]
MLFRSSSALFLCLMTTTSALSADNGPITSITLSSGGLAEIVRKADIDSTGLINMTVPLDQVNDVLKSIVVFDQAGVVEGITLPGPNPLAETFKNLPFSVDDLQSPARLLSALQGTRVRLDRAGSSVEGLVLGVSARDQGDKGQAFVVSVLSEDRITGVELSADTEITFLDEDIRQKVARALAAVGTGKADGARTVALKVGGEGAREVAVSYVVPAPIWKTAYRVVTMADDKARLQAWAVLENASGEDWENVEVTLSSGAPVTLKQRLHDLYWKQRREVPIDVSEGYVPPTDTGAEPVFDVAESEAYIGGASRLAALAAPAATPQPRERRMSNANVGEAVEGAVTASFTLPWPVSLESGETLSAPIVDKVVSAETVSVYQPESGLSHPIAAILIDNETDTSLPKGILTVYDEQEGYVGDAQINGMPSGESRMASFATDKKVRIAQDTTGDNQIVSIKVHDGVLTASVRERSSTRYAIKGAPDGERTVIIEHAKRPGWQFSSGNEMDSTVSHHRLRVEVAAGATETVTALHERTLSETYALMSTDANKLLYLSLRSPDKAVAAKLKRLSELQNEITQIERQMQQLRLKKDEETNDQERHRANLAAIEPGADLYKRAARKLADSETRIEDIETEIAALNERRLEIRETLGDAIRTF